MEALLLMQKLLAAVFDVFYPTSRWNTIEYPPFHEAHAAPIGIWAHQSFQADLACSLPLPVSNSPCI